MPKVMFRFMNQKELFKTVYMCVCGGVCVLVCVCVCVSGGSGVCVIFLYSSTISKHKCTTFYMSKLGKNIFDIKNTTHYSPLNYM